jgi:hypothetical protein
MIPVRKLRPEFLDGVYGWVDRALDALLDCREPRPYFIELGFPNK